MRSVLLVALSAALLAGCGAAGTPLSAPRQAASLQARTDAGLREGVIVLRKQRFKQLDLNGDGALVPGEASDSALRLPGIVEGFADYDANGDGKIVIEEFLRDDVIRYWMGELRPRIQTMFQRIDTNHDFKLTGAELEKIKLYFSMFPETHGADLNQDGEVPYGEFEDAYVSTLPKVQPQPQEQAFLKKLPAVR
jgi:Ca2+-binding EF-hand superfamily protein